MRITKRKPRAALLALCLVAVLVLALPLPARAGTADVDITVSPVRTIFPAAAGQLLYFDVANNGAQSLGVSDAFQVTDSTDAIMSTVADSAVNLSGFFAALDLSGRPAGALELKFVNNGLASAGGGSVNVPAPFTITVIDKPLIEASGLTLPATGVDPLNDSFSFSVYPEDVVTGNLSGIALTDENGTVYTLKSISGGGSEGNGSTTYTIKLSDFSDGTNKPKRGLGYTLSFAAGVFTSPQLPGAGNEAFSYAFQTVPDQIRGTIEHAVASGGADAAFIGPSAEGPWTPVTLDTPFAVPAGSEQKLFVKLTPPNPYVVPNFVSRSGIIPGDWTHLPDGSYVFSVVAAAGGNLPDGFSIGATFNDASTPFGGAITGPATCVQGSGSDAFETPYDVRTGNIWRVMVDEYTLARYTDYLDVYGTTTKLFLKAPMLNRLSPGQHTLLVLLQDVDANRYGYLSYTFTVEAPAAQEDPPPAAPTGGSPQTGDAQNPLLWAGLLTLSLLGIVVLLGVRRRRPQ